MLALESRIQFHYDWASIFQICILTFKQSISGFWCKWLHLLSGIQRQTIQCSFSCNKGIDQTFVQIMSAYVINHESSGLIINYRTFHSSFLVFGVGIWKGDRKKRKNLPCLPFVCLNDKSLFGILIKVIHLILCSIKKVYFQPLVRNSSYLPLYLIHIKLNGFHK